MDSINNINIETELKNEIYGIKQIIEILEKLKTIDLKKFDGKVINKRLVTYLGKQFTIDKTGFSYDTYFYLDILYNKQVLNFLIYNKYNLKTKSYVECYCKYDLALEKDIIIPKSGREKQLFNLAATKREWNLELLILRDTLNLFENELRALPELLAEFYTLKKDLEVFKNKRTSVFKSNIHLLNHLW